MRREQLAVRGKERTTVRGKERTTVENWLSPELWFYLYLYLQGMFALTCVLVVKLVCIQLVAYKKGTACDTVYL